MRRLILIVFFAISSLVIFAQVVPTKTLRIANANTAFGSNISVGDHIFDIATKTLYVSEIGIPSTGMISTNMLNLTKVDTQVQIVSIAVNGNEVNAISPEWAYEHSILNSAHGITETKYNQDDVTLADVQAATTSDFHNIGGTDANTQLSEATVDSYVSDNGYITDGNTGWDNSYGFITDNNDIDNIVIESNSTTVNAAAYRLDFKSPLTAVIDATIEADIGFSYTWAATAIETGYKISHFTHDLSTGHIGAYRIGSSGALTLSIANLSDGDNGTIFLELTSAPSTLTVAGYTGNVGTGATTEIVIGNTVTPTAGKHMSITYTFIGNGTSPFLYLVYGIEK